MNLLRSQYLIALAMAAMTALPSLSVAQEAKSEDVEIKIGVHKLEAKPNVLYHVTVVGAGFRPGLAVRAATLPFSDHDFRTPNTRKVHILPTGGKDVTLLVTPDVFSLSNNDRADQATLKYNITIQPLMLGEKPLAKIDAAITNDDAPFQAQFGKKARHKPYPFALKAGQLVVIEMNHKRKNLFEAGNRLDPYLYLVDANGKVVASDDDSGGNLNARILYEARADGAHTVIATSLSGNDTAEFTLTVRTAEKK